MNVLSTQVPAGQPVAISQQQEQDEGFDVEQGNASEDEQATYTELVHRAQAYINEGGADSPVMKRLMEGDPVKAVGGAVAITLQKAKMELEQTGAQVTEEMLRDAGIELIDDLVGRLLIMKRISQDQVEAVQQAAITEALTVWHDLTGGGQQ